ncbi:hypothetical protein SNE40_019129 [Patella caerulea]|uniref:Uncharacterized protein n=1 Tax=Patella caerulea TaxID=87958 RepID=A0AAN8J7E0_PATCE
MFTIEIGSVATKPIYVHETCYTNDLPSPISDPYDPYFFPDSPNVSDSDDTDSNTPVREDSEDTEYDLNKVVVQDWLDSTNLVQGTDETAPSNITLISDPSSDPTTPLIPHKLRNALSIPTTRTIVPPQAKTGD